MPQTARHGSSLNSLARTPQQRAKATTLYFDQIMKTMTHAEELFIFLACVVYQVKMVLLLATSLISPIERYLKPKATMRLVYVLAPENTTRGPTGATRQ